VAGRVGAILVQEEGVLRCLAAALLDERADRDPGARLDLVEPREPWELLGRLTRDLTDAGRRPASGADEAARDAVADATCELDPVADPVAHRGRELGRLRARLAALVGDPLQRLGQLALAGTPVGPAGDRRPRDRVRRRADDEAEVPGAERELVDVGPRRSLSNRAHACRRRDLVDGADDRQ